MEPNNNFFNDIKPLTKYTSQDTNTAVDTQSGLIQVDTQQQEPIQLRMSDPLLDLSKSTPAYPRGIWFFAILAVIILGVILSFIFSTASVTITPKILSFPVDKTLILNKNNLESLPYETVELDSIKTIPIEVNEKVEKKDYASGTVIVYNTYSDTPQRLVKNTRFESQDGYIYRIAQDVLIPGYKKIDGKVIPGEISVSVKSDIVGEKYNIQAGNFTVPGFKGGPQFDKIYAISKDSFTGGLEGTYYQPSGDSNLSETDTKNLQSKLEADVLKNIPKDYVFIQGLSVFTVNQSNATISKEEKKNVEVGAHIKSFIFKSEDLQKFLLDTGDSLKKGGVLDPKLLVGEIVTSDLTTNTYTIYISGNLTKQAEVDENQIKNALVGKTKKDFIGIISSFGDTIEKAELSIKPFWVFKIPKTIEKIKIIKNK